MLAITISHPDRAIRREAQHVVAAALLRSRLPLDDVGSAVELLWREETMRQGRLGLKAGPRPIAPSLDAQSSCQRVLPSVIYKGDGGCDSHAVSEKSNICASEPPARPSNDEILTPEEKKARAAAIAREQVSLVPSKKSIFEEARELKLFEPRKGMSHAEASKLLEDASR